MAKTVFPKCLRSCSSNNYYGSSSKFESRENSLQKTDCVFNCMNKYDYALFFTEEATKSHSFYKNTFDKRHQAYLSEDKKIQGLIEKLF